MNITKQSLLHCFTYHEATEEQRQRYKKINVATAVAAEALLDHCPDSRERSLALTKIQEARMWANAAIALNEKEPSA